MPNTYILISANTLATATTSVTFSSIPATYTDLVVRISARTDRVATNDSIRMIINSNVTSVYSFTRLTGDGTTASWGRSTGAGSALLQLTNASTSTSNTFDNTEVYIPNYLSTANKAFSSVMMREDNSTAETFYNTAHARLFSNTSAITSLSFEPNSGPNFVSGSSFYLYGIKNS